MNRNIQTALKLRFEYYNIYESKEELWHKKYEKHHLYSVIVESFNYGFKDIAKIMPKLLEEFEKKL